MMQFQPQRNHDDFTSTSQGSPLLSTITSIPNSCANQGRSAEVTVRVSSSIFPATRKEQEQLHKQDCTTLAIVTMARKRPCNNNSHHNNTSLKALALNSLRFAHFLKDLWLAGRNNLEHKRVDSFLDRFHIETLLLHPRTPRSQAPSRALAVDSVFLVKVRVCDVQALIPKVHIPV